ncbi:tyrosine-type recombinase/integrase [Aeromonas veronii]|uniref:tyrosine-type recombinase/integrase n=1 Tax=Aeromonas veronii TaxID=654 RepID=UPI003BA0333E
MIRQRGNKWQVDVMVGDKRVRQSAPTEEAAKQLEKDLLNSGRSDTITMFELIEKTWLRSWRNAKSGEKIKGIATKVIKEMKWVKLDVKQLTRRDLEEMMDFYRERGNSDATVNRKLASITKLLSTAVELEYIKHKPPVKQTRERNARVRFITQEEEERMLQIALEHEYYGAHGLMVFLLDTGCRIGEALKLKPDDVNHELQTVTFGDTKNGDNRTIPLTDRAYQHLFKWKLLNYDKFRNQWDRVKSLMGLADDDEMVPHILRHTCASRLVQSGVDLRVVKDWLGHKTITMTMRYAHLRIENLMAAKNILQAANAVKTTVTL